MSEILVITCPSGKQCSKLIPLLYNKGKFKLRLAAHSQKSLSRLQETYPDAEVVQSELSSLKECRQLLEGATAVYHVGPSFHSRETEIGFNMIDAAVSEARRPNSSFKHFVFSSVLCTQHTRLMQHDLKAKIEERLYISPLNYTVLQPTNFMDAYPVAMYRDQSNPVMERLWVPEIPNSLVALRDLAEAAVRVLTEREAHYFAQYPLCSTLPISDTEVIRKIEIAINKKIGIKKPTFEEGVQNVMEFLFKNGSSKMSGDKSTEDLDALAAEGDLRPDIVKDEAERLVLFYNRRGLKGSPNVLRWIIGREPTSVEEWIQAQLI